MKIEQRVYNMLTENTGIHPMDSGMAEGRGWQKNQKKTLNDFIKEPRVTYEIDGDGKDSSDINPTVSLFHYLVNNLEEDEICEAFNRLPCKEWDSEYYGISQKQEEYLLNRLGLSPVGEAGNSYNDDSMLSQVIQWQGFTNDGTNIADYILLQIHNGADVRGGYTDAKLFKICNDSGYFTGCPDVYGEIDGIEVSTTYDGSTLLDDDGNAIKIESSNISLDTF